MRRRMLEWWLRREENEDKKMKKMSEFCGDFLNFLTLQSPLNRGRVKKVYTL